MRVKNPCRANKECMGCNLLHYAYPAQLKTKKDLIKESLKKYTELGIVHKLRLIKLLG